MTPNGAAIKAIRELCGLSLQRLAHLTEIDPGFLSRIESGQRGASPQTLGRIADELDVPLEAITREKLDVQE